MRPRIVIPLVLAVLCFVGTQFWGAIVTWIMLFAGIGFLMDAVTLMWPKGDKLSRNRQ